MSGRATRTRAKYSFQISVNEVLSNITIRGIVGENLEGTGKKSKSLNQLKKGPALARQK